jgi:Mg2+/Co2+ transporter CorB
MTLEIGLVVISVLILLLLSAFFSGSETALTAASRARIHALEVEGDARARLVGQLLAAPERIIGTVLLGNNLVNILASALSTSLLISAFGDAGIAYATLVMTVLIVIFSEVLPKTYAIAYPDQIALTVAPIMRGTIVVLRPFTTALEFIVKQIMRVTPTKRDDDANILAAQAELRGTIQLQTRGGTVAKSDAAMLGGVLDLRELQVLDITIHRTKMESLNASDPPEKIIDQVVHSQYSRLPVWKDEPENIVGILHTKDLLAALHRANWDLNKIDVMSLAAPAWFVPDTTGLQEQLNQFLKRKTQLALVVDEYGEVQGLITLEDILEEIVGQIADEYDVGETAIRAQPDGSVIVEGTVAIRDLNRAMDWNLPDEEATTVAGLIMHEAQIIPEAGQAFTFYGYRFEILRKARNKINAIRVRKLASRQRAVGQAPKA